MKKIIILIAIFSLMISVLPVLADEADNGRAATSTSDKINENKKTINLVCMSTAVGAREDKIIAAFDGLALARSGALKIRKDSLAATWRMADRKQRNAAIKAAWSAYNKAIRKAVVAFEKARKAAWNQFYKDAKICRGYNDTGAERPEADKQQ